MNLLVTGGAGFIGSNFLIYWQKKYPSDLLVNLDKLTYAGNLDNLRRIENNSNYKFVKGDICDKKLVDKVMEGIDIVVHFAAESHVDRSISKPSVFIQTNVVGTQVLLESALKNKVKRFHHISTDEVFGSLDINDKNKFDESTPYDPSSPYAASKAASDHLVRAFYKTYGFPITVTNCSNNFGPFQYPEKLIPLAITNILEDKKIPIYGDGLNVRDWLFVVDHCKAIDVVLRQGKIGDTYCVGGMNTDISNIEIIKKVLQIFGKDENFIVHIKDRPGHDKKYAMDWTKINRELGWQPESNFELLLENTISWYKSNIVWWKKLKDTKFSDYYKDQYQDL